MPEPVPVLAEVSTRLLLDPIFTVKGLSAYCHISVTKLRALLTDPMHPLPHYRVHGKILIRQSEFLEWLKGFKPNETALHQMAKEFLADLYGRKSA